MNATNQTSAYEQWWSVNNAMTMCAVLLIFAFFVLSLTGYLMKHGQSGAVLLRVFGTVMVITMATFLVVAGYDDQQLGAPLGLLGTIVGYLLGKDASGQDSRPAKAEDQPSLVPERVDRVQGGGAAGREIAEDNAD
jgi:ABC-type xylose transport system permease subunit